jgi:hypothetical protein
MGAFDDQHCFERCNYGLSMERKREKMSLKKREIIQISNGGTVVGQGGQDYDVLALCNDGTVWAYTCDKEDNMSWQRMPPIPQEVKPNDA